MKGGVLLGTGGRGKHEREPTLALLGASGRIALKKKKNPRGKRGGPIILKKKTKDSSNQHISDTKGG